MSVSLEEQLACAKRELGKRIAVYPHFIKKRKISEVKAAAEIEAMRAIVGTLRDCLDEYLASKHPDTDPEPPQPQTNGNAKPF